MSEKKPKGSLGTRILVGVLAGIACGVFLGELTAPLNVVGRIYVGLLQMTVLPYVTVSLIQKIGGLSFAEAKRLSGRAGLVMLALWSIALFTVFVMPLSLPEWDAGTFFSSSLVERPREFDFLGLYLPTNPFHSLSNNVVPAVVLFSILVGVALIGVPTKERLLEPLSVVAETLGRIAGFIVRLAPYGTFALTADAAGSLSPGELARLAGYVSTYTVAIVILSFLVLPGFVATLTPFRFRHVLKGTRDAVLTAFATGKLFAVLPVVINDVRKLLVGQGVSEEEARTAADVFVPLGYPFPHAGKVLSLLFIPFAAWYIGSPLELHQYPMLLSVGLFAFFGSPIAAIPFLLDVFRLPVDLLPLFLVAGIWCARIGDVLGAVHLTAFSLLCSAWNHGWLRVRPARLATWIAVASVAGICAVIGNRLLVTKSLVGQERTADLVASMDLLNEQAPIEAEAAARPNPSSLRPGESRLERIRRTGELRVGYVPGEPPFCYENAAGRMVGLDVDLAQRLAKDLSATLVLVPATRTTIPEAMAADHFDVAIGGIASTIRNLADYRESVPYLNLHAAFLVPDSRVRDFRTLDAIRALDRVRIGFESGGLLVQPGRDLVKGIEIVEIPSVQAYLEGEVDIDALLTTAEVGAVTTMLHPLYSVVVPDGVQVRVPLVFAVQKSEGLVRLVDTWIRLKREDGMIGDLYDHWILGKRTRVTKPRWSVVRNVFGWVE